MVQKAKFPFSSNVKAILGVYYSDVYFLWRRGGGGKHAQKPKFGDFSAKKKLLKALRSVQFLASFTSFYFEILTYLACGEEIIRLAFKNTVKLGENQLVISGLSDMLQEILNLLLMRYIYIRAETTLRNSKWRSSKQLSVLSVY